MHRPTLNQFGYQSSVPSPLVHEWITSFDGKHPLLDVGCAFGINTDIALKNHIPTVALDPSVTHIETLLKELGGKCSTKLLTAIIASIPYQFSFPDNHFSGILCSSVFHFLLGNEIEESIRLFNRSLIKGGKLLISSNSEMMLGYVDEGRKASFDKELAKGVKWPGVVTADGDFISKFSKMHSPSMRLTLPNVMPKFLHFCSVKQITDELEMNKFRVVSAEYGEHHGHPDKEGIGKLTGHNLHIVAVKV